MASQSSSWPSWKAAPAPGGSVVLGGGELPQGAGFRGQGGWLSSGGPPALRTLGLLELVPLTENSDSLCHDLAESPSWTVSAYLPLLPALRSACPLVSWLPRVSPPRTHPLCPCQPVASRPARAGARLQPHLLCQRQLIPFWPGQVSHLPESWLSCRPPKERGLSWHSDTLAALISGHTCPDPCISPLLLFSSFPDFC